MDRDELFLGGDEDTLREAIIEAMKSRHVCPMQLVSALEAASNTNPHIDLFLDVAEVIYREEMP